MRSSAKAEAETTLARARNEAETTLSSAKAQAEKTVTSANASAHQTLSSAKAEAESTLTSARNEAGSTLSTARAEAKSTVTSANDEAERTLSSAKAQAEKTVTSANESAERTLSTAKAEAERTVSTANASAEKTLSTAKADSERMVTEARKEAESTLTSARAEAASTRATSRAQAQEHVERVEQAVLRLLDRANAVEGDLGKLVADARGSIAVARRDGARRCRQAAGRPRRAPRGARRGQGRGAGQAGSRPGQARPGPGQRPGQAGRSGHGDASGEAGRARLVAAGDAGGARAAPAESRMEWGAAAPKPQDDAPRPLVGSLTAPAPANGSRALARCGSPPRGLQHGQERCPPRRGGSPPQGEVRTRGSAARSSTTPSSVPGASPKTYQPTRPGSPRALRGRLSGRSSFRLMLRRPSGRRASQARGMAGSLSISRWERAAVVVAAYTGLWIAWRSWMDVLPEGPSYLVLLLATVACGALVRHWSVVLLGLVPVAVFLGQGAPDGSTARAS